MVSVAGSVTWDRFTYPEISRAGIKIELEILGWSADGHFRKVFRVILHVLRWDLASLTVGGSLLLQDVLLHVGFAAHAGTMLALMVDLVVHEVRPLFGGADLVLLEKVDIGLGTRTLVLGVMDKLDLIEIASHDDRVWNLE